MSTLALPARADVTTHAEARRTVIVAIGLDPELIELVRVAGHGVGVVEPFAAPDAAANAMRRIAMGCAVFRVPADGDAAVQRDLMQLREQFRQSPMIALFDRRDSSPSALLAICARGTTEAIAVNGLPRISVLRDALHRCSHSALHRRLWNELPHRDGDPLVTLLKCATRQALTPVTVRALAELAGMHERTLRKHCVALGLPNPQWIIGWARMLMVAYFLQDSARSVTSICRLLQFASLAAMRNQFRRYTRLSIRTIRRDDALGETHRAIGRVFGVNLS